MAGMNGNPIYSYDSSYIKFINEIYSLNCESKIDRMIYKAKFITVFFFFLSSYFTGISAQSIIGNAGGNDEGDGGSVSYTIGQVFYKVIGESNGTLLQGVQQPYEINEVTGLEDFQNMDGEVLIYPNPVENFLMLNIQADEAIDLKYEIFNLQGKLLRNSQINSTETRISMESLAPSVYYLKISDGNQLWKVFKIVKN